MKVTLNPPGTVIDSYSDCWIIKCSITVNFTKDPWEGFLRELETHAGIG